MRDHHLRSKSATAACERRESNRTYGEADGTHVWDENLVLRRKVVLGYHGGDGEEREGEARPCATRDDGNLVGRDGDGDNPPRRNLINFARDRKSVV